MVDRRKQKQSKSCTFCRRRKIKCDLDTPCSSCVRYGCLDCNYPKSMDSCDRGSNRRIKIEKEMSALDKRMKRLQQSLTHGPSVSPSNGGADTQSNLSRENPFTVDRVNFHDKFFSGELEKFAITSKGPLSWFSLIKIDPSLSQAQLKKIVETREISEEIERQKDFKRSQGLLNNFTGLSMLSILSYYDSSFYSSRLGGGEPSIIEYVLPCRHVTVKLIDRYFSHIHCLHRVFIEEKFREAVANITNYETGAEEGKTKIVIRSNKDIATFGSLLIVLRLAYLTLFICTGEINSFEGNDSEILYLVENHIPPYYVKMAEGCIDFFKEKNEHSIETFQLFLLDLYSHQIDPEGGDALDKGVSSILISYLFNVAYSLGLERDPSNVPGLAADETEAELRRWLWLSLLLGDARNSTLTGSPLNFIRFDFDTKIPDLSVISGFNSMNKLISNCYIYFDFSIKVLEQVKATGGCKVHDLMEKLEHRRKDCVYSQIRDQLYDTELHKDKPFSKMLVLKAFFHDNAFEISVLFHVFTVQERQCDMIIGGRCLQKILTIIGDVLECACEFMKNIHVFLGNCSDVNVAPPLEFVLHKSLLILHAILARVKGAMDLSSSNMNNISVHNDERLKYEQNLKNLVGLRAVIEQFIEVSLIVVKRLSKRYLYASFIVRSVKLLESSIESEYSFEGSLLFSQFPKQFLSSLFYELDDSLKKINANISNELKVTLISRQVSEDGILQDTNVNLEDMTSFPIFH